MIGNALLRHLSSHLHSVYSVFQQFFSRRSICNIVSYLRWPLSLVIFSPHLLISVIIEFVMSLTCKNKALSPVCVATNVRFNNNKIQQHTLACCRRVRPSPIQLAHCVCGSLQHKSFIARVLKNAQSCSRTGC